MRFTQHPAQQCQLPQHAAHEALERTDLHCLQKLQGIKHSLGDHAWLVLGSGLHHKCCTTSHGLSGALAQLLWHYGKEVVNCKPLSIPANFS